jgi:hypothetical protein
VAVLEPKAEEPDQPFNLANLCAGVARLEPPEVRPRICDPVALEFRYERNLSVDAAQDELDRARRLAVDHVEWALAVKTHEHLERAWKPQWVSAGKPRVMMRGVYVVPAGAITLLVDDAIWMRRCHNLDLVTCFHETLGQSPRVILHSADAVSGDRDDANPHRLMILVGRAVQQGLSTLRPLEGSNSASPIALEPWIRGRAQFILPDSRRC